MECPNTTGCPIYNKFKTEALKNLYIKMFCFGKFETCKRKQVKDSGQPVSPSLLPDGKFFENL